MIGLKINSLCLRILLLLFVGQGCVFAQEFQPKHTFNFELGLPNSFSNKAFNDVMQGLVQVEPYYQYAFKNGIIAGIGVGYQYMGINEFKVPVKTDGGLHSGRAFLKVGYERFVTKNFAFDVALKIGYSANYFKTTINDTLLGVAFQQNSMYIAPTIGLILKADEVSSYRLFFGYSFQNFNFNLSMLGIQTNGGYSSTELNRISTILTVGFGYTHYFGFTRMAEPDDFRDEL